MNGPAMGVNANVDLSKIKRGPIVTALIIGAFVSILNETLLNIAFPELMTYFDIKESMVQWLATSYMLVVGVLVPITALLQNWFTTRQMFIGAMTLFLTGTILCAIAPVFGVLLLGRIVQAMGTGLMMPVMMNTFLIIFPPEQRGRAMGLIGLVMMTAPTIGPTLSGLIVDSLGWRWLFYLVIPLAAFSIIFTIIYLKNVSVLTRPRVDILSILLSCVGFGGLVYGFSSAGEGSWSDPQVVWCLVAGGVSLLLFVWRQLTMREPILDLRAFRYSMFSLVTVLMLVLMMSMFASMIMLPLFLQNVLLLSALASGLILMPGGILNAIMAPISGLLFDKFGPRVLVIPGLAIISVVLWLYTGIQADWTGGHIIVLNVFMMLGISLVMMPAQTTALNQLPSRLYPHGTALLNTLSQVAGAVGMALFISIMSSGSRRYMTGVADPTNPAEGIPAMIAGLHDAFVFGGVLSVIALVIGFFVRRVKPNEGDGPKQEAAAQTVGKPLRSE